jgi:hypothetical protein
MLAFLKYKKFSPPLSLEKKTHSVKYTRKMLGRQIWSKAQNKNTRQQFFLWLQKFIFPLRLLAAPREKKYIDLGLNHFFPFYFTLNGSFYFLAKKNMRVLKGSEIKNCCRVFFFCALLHIWRPNIFLVYFTLWVFFSKLKGGENFLYLRKASIWKYFTAVYVKGFFQTRLQRYIQLTSGLTCTCPGGINHACIRANMVFHINHAYINAM